MSSGNLPEEKILRRGLEEWRLSRLYTIEDDMHEETEDYRAAQDGLGIVHRNPGEVRPDIIEYLWEKLNHSATELEQLDGRHQELMEMDLLHLIVEYKRRRKDKPRWTFQSY